MPQFIDVTRKNKVVRIRLSENWNLENPSHWNKDVCVALAEAKSITLKKKHWNVISFARKYYKKYRMFPMTRIITIKMHKKWKKSVGSNYILDLFHGDLELVRILAGLPSHLTIC